MHGLMFLKSDILYLDREEINQPNRGQQTDDLFHQMDKNNVDMVR